MKKILDLTQMKQKKKGTVIAVAGGPNLKKRLETLGIRKGAEVTKVSAQVMRGPIIVQVVNTQVAIGFGMAKKIIVEVEKESNIEKLAVKNEKDIITG
jgi:ferrous iron transport protein A